jgi:hypothetical protein
MIGGGSMVAAANQFPGDFGASPLINLLPIIQELLACYKIQRDAVTSTLKGLDIERCASALRPTLLNVSSDVITSIEIIGQSVSNSVNSVGYDSLLAQLQGGYHTGLNQALAGILDDLNTTAGIAGSGGGLIAMFQNPQNFVDMVAGLVSISAAVGTAPESLASVGLGSVGAALARGVEGASALAASAGGSGANSSSGSGSSLQAITAALNMFMSNPVAKSEMASGQINPQSLLSIPLKYAKKQVNDPQQLFNSLLGGS